MSLSNQPLKRLRSSNPWAYLLVAPPFLLMLLLILYPAVVSVIRTLLPSVDGVRRFGIENYQAFFSDPISVRNLVFTLFVTFVTLGLLFAVCFPIALFLRFSKHWTTSWIQGLALFPLFVPGIILAYALIRFLGPNGLFETLLELTTGFGGYRTPYLRPSGAVIGLIWESIPLTVLILTAGLSQVPDGMLESARDVGAGRLRIFYRIVLPLVSRSVLIAFSLNFLGIIGSFTLPYLLGPASPEMMGVFMQRTFGDARAPERAETQAVITFLLCSVVGFLYVRAAVRQRQEEGL